MADTTAPTSIIAAFPRPSLNLREILLVHLLVFHRAVFASFILDFTGPCLFTLKRRAYPVYIFQSILVSNLVCVDREKFNDDDKYRAFIMGFRCDTFCPITERFVQDNLQGKEFYSFCLSSTNQSQSC